MKIQLIRNATMRIKYAGKTFLTDPMLGPKGSLDSFAGIEKNPTADLPLSLEEIIKDIDCVIVSHTHPDHFDSTASEIIPKNIPIFHQECDKSVFTDKGFLYLNEVINEITWENISISRVSGQHGKGKILELMGTVSGFVFKAEGEPVVYWVGDSILCDEVKNTIMKFNPDIIVTHSGGAILPGFDPIIMNDEETVNVLKISDKAKVVAVHLESLDHCTITRNSILEAVEKAGIPAHRIIIPMNGEILELNTY